MFINVPESSIMSSSKLFKLIVVSLTMSVFFERVGPDDSVGTQMFFEHNVADEFSLASTAPRSASETSATSPSSCKASLLAHCKGPPSTRPKKRVLLPRRSSRSPRLSGGVKFDVVRDLLVLGNRPRSEIHIIPRNLSTLRSLDLSFLT